jgi:hypothetical protein
MKKKLKKRKKTKETIYIYGILAYSYLNHLSIKYIMILIMWYAYIKTI